MLFYESIRVEEAKKPYCIEVQRENRACIDEQRSMVASIFGSRQPGSMQMEKWSTIDWEFGRNEKKQAELLTCGMKTD